MAGPIADKLAVLGFGSPKKFSELCKQTEDPIIIERIFIVSQFNTPVDMFIERMGEFGLTVCTLFRDKVEFVAVAQTMAAIDGFLDGSKTATIVSQA